MIEKIHGKYILYCDICDEDIDQEFNSFMEAVDFKKQNDWHSRKIDGEWIDGCLSRLFAGVSQ